MLRNFWKMLCIIIVGLSVAFSAQANPSSLNERSDILFECSAQTNAFKVEEQATDFTEAFLLNVSAGMSAKELESTSDCLLGCEDTRDECLADAREDSRLCMLGCEGQGIWCRKDCHIARLADKAGCLGKFTKCSLGCFTGELSSESRPMDHKL